MTILYRTTSIIAMVLVVILSLLLVRQAMAGITDCALGLLPADVTCELPGGYDDIRRGGHESSGHAGRDGGPSGGPGGVDGPGRDAGGPARSGHGDGTNPGQGGGPRGHGGGHGHSGTGNPSNGGHK